jgi:hypothetical protein
MYSLGAGSKVLKLDAAQTEPLEAPLRPARVIPKPSAGEVGAAQADGLAEARARVELLAEVVYGSSRPVAWLLDDIVRDPRGSHDVAGTLRNAAPLAGADVPKFGGLLGVKPDAARQAARDQFLPLVKAVGAVAPFLKGVEDKLLADHRDVQKYARVEIPAPSSALAAVLRDETPHAAAKLDPATTRELAKLRRALDEGLSHNEKRHIAKGDLAALAVSTGLSSSQTQRLADTAAKVNQFTKLTKVLAKAQTPQGPVIEQR